MFVSLADFENLLKRVTTLEAELKRTRETEWDRFYIYAMLGFVKAVDLRSTTIAQPNVIDNMFKQEYYHRIAELEAAHDRDANTIT